MVQQLDQNALDALDAPTRSEPDLEIGPLLPVDPPPPMAKVVGDDLRTKLLEGKWLYEQQLPSEHDLSKTYGVSRPTIREALRTLQTEELIEIQRGKAGGALVTFPSERSREEMTKDINRRLPELVELLDGRLALEPFFARRAASRRTPEHLKALEDSVQSMKEAAKVLKNTEKLIADDNLLPQVKQPIVKARERARLNYRRADNKLHRTVSAAARNSYLLDVFGTLRAKFFTFPGIDLVIEHGKPEHDQTDPDKTRFDEVIEQHKAIVRAIRKQDKIAAEHEMREHIESTKRTLSRSLENELEKHLVNKHKSEKDPVANLRAAADAFRGKLLTARVFALVRDANGNAESTPVDDDVFLYINEGYISETPNEEQQQQQQVMVPVFTRRDFIQAAINRYTDWQGYAQKVLELEGGELLSKLDPLSKLDRDAVVVINPGTSLEFRLPVARE